MPQTMVKGDGASEPMMPRIGSLSWIARNAGHGSRSGCRRPSAVLADPKQARAGQRGRATHNAGGHDRRASRVRFLIHEH